MAKFFDPKEDVMDIKITPYGRHLLSKGKFTPAFYAFYDDDIIYDLQYANASLAEHQNDIETRIQQDTPRLKAQSCFSGIETAIKKVVNANREGDILPQPAADKHHALALPLGHSNLNSTHLPAWDTLLLNGEIKDSVNYLTASTAPNIKIPQAECEIVFKGRAFPDGYTPPLSTSDQLINNLQGGLSDAETEGIFGGTFDEFEDGTIFKVYKDFILLEINEKNTDYLSQNFDIEVYEMVSVTGSSTPISGQKNEYEELVPLSFARGGMSDLGALYTTDETDDFNDLFPETDSRYVEHFFEINVDREIDPALLCSHLPQDKARRKSIAVEFECPDLTKGSTFSDQGKGLYDSTNSSDPEDCD
jgi:hypothetical protein